MSSILFGAKRGAWDRYARTEFMITKSAHLQYFCYCCCTLAVFFFLFCLRVLFSLASARLLRQWRPSHEWRPAAACYRFLYISRWTKCSPEFGHDANDWCYILFSIFKGTWSLHLQSHIQVKRGNQANDKKTKREFSWRVQRAARLSEEVRVLFCLLKRSCLCLPWVLLMLPRYLLLSLYFSVLSKSIFMFPGLFSESERVH